MSSGQDQNPFAPREGDDRAGRPDLSKHQQPSGMPTPPPPSGYEAVLPPAAPYGAPPRPAAPYGQPGYGQPAAPPPAYGQPTYGAPAYGQPSYDQPGPGQPAYGQPVHGQPSYGGYPTPQGSYPPAGYGAPPTDGLAIASFVTSLVGLLGLAGLTGPVGLGLGIASLRRIKRTGAGGRGFAIAGIAIGAVGTLILLAVIGLIIWAIAWGSSSSSFDDGEWSYDTSDVSVQLHVGTPLDLTTSRLPGDVLG